MPRHNPDHAPALARLFRLEHHDAIPGAVLVPAIALAKLDARVEQGDQDACWLYRPAPHNGAPPPAEWDRYFPIYWRDEEGRKWSIPAHRLALLRTLPEPISCHLLGCHSCNRRACCNPGHIYAGTSKQNAADRMKAERQAELAAMREALYRRSLERLEALRSPSIALLSSSPG